MKLIPGEKGSGKTLELLRQLDGDRNAVLISPTPTASYWAQKKARELQLDVTRDQFLYVATAHDMLKRRKDLTGVPARPKRLVDQLELCLNELWGYQQITATMDASTLQIRWLPAPPRTQPKTNNECEAALERAGIV